jgi:acetyl esterase
VEVPFSAAAQDGWQALEHVVRHAAQWQVDPARVAVVGESAGATIAALAAIRAHESDLSLRAQVLINPCVDLTSTALDYPSMTEHASSPTLDPLADHGRTYAQHLRRAGTHAEVAEYAGAGHAFISMPGLVSAARPARREILSYLHGRL